MASHNGATAIDVGLSTNWAYMILEHYICRTLG